MIFSGNSTPKINELAHHGILGQKWGVRRYQNADGSLTEAGKARYNYGSVNVTRNERNDTYTLSKRNSQQKVDIKRDVLRQYEKQVQDEVVSLFADAYGLSMKQTVNEINRDKGLMRDVNDIIDSYMDYQLSSVIDNASKNSSQNHGADRDSTNKQNKSKPKYTQEEAIEKAYKDLEKKYPNFNDLPEDEQDQLWMDYVNESGLYEYI